MNDESAVNKAVRVLMWAHYCYLLLLPALAVIAAGRLGLGIKFAEVVGIVGLGPVLMYALFLANGYTMPKSLPVALIVTLAVPLQIALSVLVFGGRSGWLFLAEDATVEIGAFVLGTLFTALPNVRRKGGWKGFIFVSIFAIPIFGGGMIPHLLMVWRGYGGASLWLLLFVTSFLTAFSEHAKLYANLIREHQKTGEFQEVEMRYDGGFIARLLGVNNQIRVIGPFQNRYKKGDVRGLQILLGFVSFFMVFFALMISEFTVK